VSYKGGRDGEKVASQGRKKLYRAMDRMQYITANMSTFHEDQRQCLEDAPNPVMLVLHLSPLGVVTTST
jgi:hypothetical protein